MNLFDILFKLNSDQVELNTLPIYITLPFDLLP